MKFYEGFMKTFQVGSLTIDKQLDSLTNYDNLQVSSPSGYMRKVQCSSTTHNINQEKCQFPEKRCLSKKKKKKKSSFRWCKLQSASLLTPIIRPAEHLWPFVHHENISDMSDRQSMAYLLPMISHEPSEELPVFFLPGPNLTKLPACGGGWDERTKT